ncbi:N-acetyltransferase 9 [Dimargaris cristalligena]|nr:N-acetyltransferase 9 [Dimargaris cristalligena]
MTASEPLTLEEEFEMQQKWATDEDKCTFIVLARNDAPVDQNIHDLSAMIGDVNLFFNDFEIPTSCEIEAMIAEPSYRNRGYGTEAIRLMLMYGITHLKVTQFTAKILSKNESSRRLFATKLGFQETGFSEVFQEVSFALPVGADLRKWAEDLLQNCVTICDYDSEN